MSDRRPVVSVVIPMYNSAHYIEQTVLSATGQTLRDIEILAVDDGSVDDSATIVERLQRDDHRVSVHRHANSGAAVARNRGVQLARGEFVAFLDHDDRWFPTKLAVQVALLQSRPDASVVGCRMAYMGASGRSRGTSAHVPENLDQQAIQKGLLTPFPTLSAVVVRADQLRSVGGFPNLFGPRISLTEDLYVYARLARLGSVLCAPQVLGEYRVHEEAARTAAAEQFLPALEYTRMALADDHFIDRHTWAEFSASYQATRADRRRVKGHTHYRLAGQALVNGRYARAIKHLTVSGLLTPSFTLNRLIRQGRGGRPKSA